MRERQRTWVGRVLKRKQRTSTITKTWDIFTYSILFISLWSRSYHYSYFTIAETEATRDIDTTQATESLRALAGLELGTSDSRSGVSKHCILQKAALEHNKSHPYLFYVAFQEVDEVRASRACHLDRRLMCWSIIRVSCHAVLWVHVVCALVRLYEEVKGFWSYLFLIYSQEMPDVSLLAYFSTII